VIYRAVALWFVCHGDVYAWEDPSWRDVGICSRYVCWGGGVSVREWAGFVWGGLRLRDEGVRGGGIGGLEESDGREMGGWGKGLA